MQTPESPPTMDVVIKIHLSAIDPMPDYEIMGWLRRCRSWEKVTEFAGVNSDAYPYWAECLPDLTGYIGFLSPEDQAKEAAVEQGMHGVLGESDSAHGR